MMPCCGTIGRDQPDLLGVLGQQEGLRSLPMAPATGREQQFFGAPHALLVRPADGRYPSSAEQVGCVFMESVVFVFL